MADYPCTGTQSYSAPTPLKRAPFLDTGGGGTEPRALATARQPFKRARFLRYRRGGDRAAHVGHSAPTSLMCAPFRRYRRGGETEPRALADYPCTGTQSYSAPTPLKRAPFLDTGGGDTEPRTLATERQPFKRARFLRYRRGETEPRALATARQPHPNLPLS